MLKNALDCHYSKTGSGPAIFLIHGVGGAEDAWRFIAPKLKEKFTIITYDLRGHGKSPITNKDFNLNDLVLDFEKVREKSKIEKAHFFGHSLGGMIAPAYAKMFPNKVLSVGMLSTVAGRSIDDKEKVLAAAQNLHALVVVAGMSWEDLLVPDTEENKSDATSEADEEQTPVSTESDLDIKELSEEEIQEALLLIKKISELNVSSETIKDMEDYKIEIEDEDGIFESMDLQYLRSFYKRLTS